MNPEPAIGIFPTPIRDELPGYQLRHASYGSRPYAGMTTEIRWVLITGSGKSISTANLLSTMPGTM
ncbi:MAG: hypothetical protein ABSG91_18350 [Syntrophobacteraceae bacterium]|jgi:hypothetical protein